jgi:DNA-binding MarR family transcriptional regulator
VTYTTRDQNTDEVFDALVEILQRLRHSFRDVAVVLDPELSPLGLRLLSMVRSSGEVTGSQLVHKADSDPATISRQVKSLMDLGYLTSSEDVTDRRVRVLRLTPKGEQLSDQAWSMLRRTISAGLDDWAPEEVAALSAQLVRLLTNVADQQSPGALRADAARH